MEENKKKFVTYRQNPNIDFLFGYFNGMQVPTKQDAFKLIEVIEIDENGAKIILSKKIRKSSSSKL